MIAFEVTELLNNRRDEVRFLGVFNLPPHIKLRTRQLDWINCLLHISYFLSIISEEDADTLYPVLRRQPRQQTLRYVLDLAPRDRLEELGLDFRKLANWADVAYLLQSSAIDYVPSGLAESMDIFCAAPLAFVARDMDDWMTNHLGKCNSGGQKSRATCSRQNLVKAFPQKISKKFPKELDVQFIDFGEDLANITGGPRVLLMGRLLLDPSSVPSRRRCSLYHDQSCTRSYLFEEA